MPAVFTGSNMASNTVLFAVSLCCHNAIDHLPPQTSALFLSFLLLPEIPSPSLMPRLTFFGPSFLPRKCLGYFLTKYVIKNSGINIPLAPSPFDLDLNSAPATLLPCVLG